MNINENNWQGIFINFVLIGIILLLLFRVLRYSLPMLVKSTKRRDFIKRQLPVIEITLWFLFLSWFTFRFAQMLELYALIVAGLLFLLIFWFSRYFLRELIAGILFKSGRRYKKGDSITVAGHTGKIQNFGLELLEIEGVDGQTIFIPYSKLVGDAIHSRSESSEKSSSHTFSLKINWQGNFAELEKELQAFALTLPWVSLIKPLQTTLLDQDGDTMHINLTVYLIDHDFAINVQKSFDEKFTSEN